jgi:hypothetical protein
MLDHGEFGPRQLPAGRDERCASHLRRLFFHGYYMMLESYLGERIRPTTLSVSRSVVVGHRSDSLVRFG